MKQAYIELVRGELLPVTVLRKAQRGDVHPGLDVLPGEYLCQVEITKWGWSKGDHDVFSQPHIVNKAGHILVRQANLDEFQ